jgi:hypothetical protein
MRLTVQDSVLSDLRNDGIFHSSSELAAVILNSIQDLCLYAPNCARFRIKLPKE